jgi:hypothetical protein
MAAGRDADPVGSGWSLRPVARLGRPRRTVVAARRRRGLWARRKLVPRERAEGRLPHDCPRSVGAGKRSGLLRAALRMPARGARRSVCAMSVIMRRA